MDWRTLLKRALLVCVCFIPLAFLMILLPVAGVSAHEISTIGTPAVGTVIVQDTPTVDATVTALQKAQLAEQVEQVHLQDFWLPWTNIATEVGAFAVLGSIVRYLYNQRKEREKQLADKKDEREKREGEQQRWLEDRESERVKQAEARFQKVVEGLGSSNEATQVGSAILLRTFVHEDKDNERFYAQACDLAVAYLLLQYDKPDNPSSHASLKQALITVFKQAYPLARDLPNQSLPLDARGIRLDHVDLTSADLKQISMPFASLQNAVLKRAHLEGANFVGADLKGANLGGANLEGAYLTGADLRNVNLAGTNLAGADLCTAYLDGATLGFSDFDLGTFSYSELTGFSLEQPNCSGKDLFASIAIKLERTQMLDVRGLSIDQLIMCKDEGAIIDDYLLPDPDPSPTPTAPTQSQDHQTQSSPALPSGSSTPPSQNEEDDTSLSPGES
jgi:hypothetical protein